MSKRAKLLFLLLLVLSTGFQPLMAQIKGDTYAAAKTKGMATWVLTHSNAPGFASEDDSGVSGITFDIMQKFKEYVETNEGITISFKYETKDPDNFTLFLDEVKKSSGGVFGLSNTTITEARKRIYNFSPPYITNIGMILTHNSVPTLTDITAISTTFAGMTAITVKNSTNEKRILDIKKQYFPTLKIEYVNSFSQALDMVINDPKKFANLDFTYYFAAVQDRKPVKRHPGGDDKTEEFGIIMPKSNDWSPLLAKFMSSGFVGGLEYKQIISKNLGQSAMKFFDTLK